MRQVATQSMIIAGVLEAMLQRRGRKTSNLFERTSIKRPSWARLCKGQSKFDVEQLYDVSDKFNIRLARVFMLAEKVKNKAIESGIEIIPPIPTTKGKLTKLEGVTVVDVAVLAFLASSVIEKIQQK